MPPLPLQVLVLIGVTYRRLPWRPLLPRPAEGSEPAGPTVVDAVPALKQMAATGKGYSHDVQRAMPIILMTLAFTWLNPHVYLDTFLLIGTAGAREPDGARVAFALGAMAVSGVWFIGLGYGARALAPLFRRATAWRVLDGAIGSMVLLLAVTQLR